MELDQLVEHFERVKMTPRGFTSLCPAHRDSTPSLAVDKGTNWWLVSCRTGCTFNDVVAAAGLRPSDFSLGSSSLATPNKPDKTLETMRDMIRETRDIKWTFGQLMVEAFDLDAKQVRKVLNRYPEFLLIDLPAAMKMYAIMYAGPIPALIGDRYYPNYDRDAQGQIGARLWQEYRTQQSSLA